MVPSWLRRRWLVVMLSVVLCLAGQVPWIGSAAAQTEADGAAEWAYGLSALERDGNWDQLYDLMHPDAQAIIPRAAVVGWYREDFAPQQPQVITEITAVRQVAWTWPVTGKTYPNAYEVDYVQPFGAGPTYDYVSDTVRLVPTGNNFGWFFGRSRAFVDEQIARFPAPWSRPVSRDPNRRPVPRRPVRPGARWSSCTRATPATGATSPA